MAPTPKGQDRKRKVAEEAESSTPAKRRAAKAKNGESSTAAEAEDPFSFESKEDSHPEPLKNINIERTAFGGVKFSRSPPSASQRYAGIEKIAERRGNVSGTLITTPTSMPRPSSSVRPSISDTSKSAISKSLLIETPKATPKSKRVSNAAVSSKGDMKEKPATPNATSASHRLKAKLSTVDFANAATPKENKIKLEDYCVPPTLSDEQQFNIDLEPLRESHKLLEAGARVFALWNKDYYAAVVCGRDGLGRYYAHFVEDGLNRSLPANGVSPLSFLKNGTKVSVIIDDEDGQPSGKYADIVEVASHTNAAEWANAIFKVKVDEEDDVIDISWSKIYLNQEQFKTICSNMSTTNTTNFVEVENIVNESRSSRRSRAARFSTDSITHVATPQPPPSIGRMRSRVSKTPKAAIMKEEPAEEKQVEEEENEEKPTEKEKDVANTTPARSSRGRRSATKPEQSTPKTPARGRRTPGRKAKEVVEEAEEENADEVVAKVEEKEVEKFAEANVDDAPSAEEIVKAVAFPSVEVKEQANASVAEEEEKNLEGDIEAKTDETLEKMDVDEPVTQEEPVKLVEELTKPEDEHVKTPSEELPVVEETLNASLQKTIETTSPKKTPIVVAEPETNGNSTTIPTHVEDETKEKPSEQDAVVVNTSSGSQNGTAKAPEPTTDLVKPTTAASQSQPTTDASQSQPTTDASQSQPTTDASQSQPTTDASQSQPTTDASQSQPTTDASQSQPTTDASQSQPTTDASQSQPAADNSQPLVPIASLPAPSSEEKTIFKDMKFVLTSATRAKKNSDFNKRDYRTKIEERGGTIIDDFSSLAENAKAYLIADTYYRTHKYLSALSLSVPCVKHDWIYACVTQKQFIDHVPFMLPAGESSLAEGEICHWKPLKGVLLANKRVWVYSNVQLRPDERAISFVDIWSSIIKNLGAALVDQPFASLEEKLEYCENKSVDILLTDTSCEKQLAEKIRDLNGIAVSSEWVIQAIVTGELPDVSSSERFRFDTSA